MTVVTVERRLKPEPDSREGQHDAQDCVGKRFGRRREFCKAGPGAWEDSWIFVERLAALTDSDMVVEASAPSTSPGAETPVRRIPTRLRLCYVTAQFGSTGVAVLSPIMRLSSALRAKSRLRISKPYVQRKETPSDGSFSRAAVALVQALCRRPVGKAGLIQCPTTRSSNRLGSVRHGLCAELLQFLDGLLPRESIGLLCLFDQGLG